MKITKKILSVILSVLLAVAVFGICASAEGTASGTEAMEVTVSTDKETYEPGDNVTVTVSLKTNYNMTAFRFPIMFDSEVFELPNLIGLTALNTCRTNGNIQANSLIEGSSIMPEEYDSSLFDCILVQWTATVANSTLGCLNLPNGEACFSFTLKTKTSASGESGTIFVPAEYEGFYTQAIQTPTDATTIYYVDPATYSKSFVSATVEVVGIVADIVPNTAYNSKVVIDKTNSIVYGLETGKTLPADFSQEVLVTGSGSLSVEMAEYGYGTGTKLKVVVDDVTVKTYSVVIFGDVNGDCLIDNNDAYVISMVCANLNILTDSLVIKAADLNNDSIVDVNDLAVFLSVIKGVAVIDQANPYV